MPLDGQRLGERDKFTYTMDDGTAIKLVLDQTLGSLTECGLSATTTADAAINKPLKFKPRVVFWQAIVDGKPVRKELVCSATSTAYTSKTEVNITIDGLVGQTTGRRGETLSF